MTDFPAIFLWFSKQQANLPLFESDWYWRKAGNDGFTGTQRETDVRYELGFKVILKSLGCM